MATRMHAREAVIELLYAFDLGNKDAILQAPQYCQEKKIKNKQQEFAIMILNGVIDNIECIDNVLAKYIKGWDIGRLGILERAILRLGVYEILFSTLDKSVVINEALELSKRYGINDASKLINGVLDSIAKNEEDNNQAQQNSKQILKKDLP